MEVVLTYGVVVDVREGEGVEVEGGGGGGGGGGISFGVHVAEDGFSIRDLSSVSGSLPIII